MESFVYGFFLLCGDQHQVPSLSFYLFNYLDFLFIIIFFLLLFNLFSCTLGAGGNEWETDPKKKEILKYFLSSACCDGKKKVFIFSFSYNYLFLPLLMSLICIFFYFFFFIFFYFLQEQGTGEGREKAERVEGACDGCRGKYFYSLCQLSFLFFFFLFSLSTLFLIFLLFRFKWEGFSSRILLFRIFMVSSPSFSICFGSKVPS